MVFEKNRAERIAECMHVAQGQRPAKVEEGQIEIELAGIGANGVARCQALAVVGALVGIGRIGAGRMNQQQGQRGHSDGQAEVN
jgi:hypothetical protein